MNAKKCKLLRRALRDVDVPRESTYKVLNSGSQRRELLDGNFAFRTWHIIGLTDCARKRYQDAKKEWKRHV